MTAPTTGQASRKSRTGKPANDAGHHAIREIAAQQGIQAASDQSRRKTMSEFVLQSDSGQQHVLQPDPPVIQKPEPVAQLEAGA